MATYIQILLEFHQVVFKHVYNLAHVALHPNILTPFVALEAISIISLNLGCWNAQSGWTLSLSSGMWAWLDVNLRDNKGTFL